MIERTVLSVLQLAVCADSVTPVSCTMDTWHTVFGRTVLAVWWVPVQYRCVTASFQGGSSRSPGLVRTGRHEGCRLALAQKTCGG
jgi:hypothetical protein